MSPQTQFCHLPQRLTRGRVGICWYGLRVWIELGFPQYVPLSARCGGGEDMGDSKQMTSISDAKLNRPIEPGEEGI
jgi:hypothetical protein